MEHGWIKAMPRVQPLIAPAGLAPYFRWELNAAEKLAEVYSIRPRPLGFGTSGEVLLGTHRATAVSRAVKKVSKRRLRASEEGPPGAEVEAMRERVRREVEILRSLDHPHVLRIFESFEDEAQLYMVMELLEGGSLLQYLQVQPSVVGPGTGGTSTMEARALSEGEAAWLFQQMLSAVNHVHSNEVVHRDLKLEHFLFTKPPTRTFQDHLKLIDFGNARCVGSAGGDLSPRAGSSKYTAPEVRKGRATDVLAARADMWALGVALHAMLLGHLPTDSFFEEPGDSVPVSHGAAVGRLSRAASDLLRKLLSIDPTLRPLTLEALRHDWLAHVVQELEKAAERIVALPQLQQLISAYQEFPRLKRLALVAAARYSAEKDVAAGRPVLLALEGASAGRLSMEALGHAELLRSTHISVPSSQEISHSPSPAATAALAETLRDAFDVLDIDGSGHLGWSELLAAGMEIEAGEASLPMDAHQQPLQLKELPEPKLSLPKTVSRDSLDSTEAPPPPPDQFLVGDLRSSSGALGTLRITAVRSAFNLLSQGTGKITVFSLGQLLRTSSSRHSGLRGRFGNVPCQQTLERMVREVSPSGQIWPEPFKKLLFSHAT